MNGEIQTNESAMDDRPCQLSRRRFLQASGATMGMVMVPGMGEVWGRTQPYERTVIAKLSDLQNDKPVNFSYPDRKSNCMLVKLGVPAGGGVGPDKDIVAFNVSCPHMGTPLLGGYNAKHKGLGPCRSHLTRFDLTRFGIVISGHATESLVQVLLEVENGEVIATGIRGLIYGRAANVG